MARQPRARRETTSAMARLKDKIVLITGAAGAIGQAVAAAVRREGGLAIASDLAGRAGIDHALDVTAEEDWRVVLADDRARARPPRRPRQCGRDRAPRQHRGHRLCGLAARARGQSRRHVSRLQACACPAQARRRLDREHLLDLRHRRRPQSRGLQCLQRRRAAVDQIGRAPRRAAQAAGALQLGASGVPGRADGRRHSGADRSPGHRARSDRARHPARTARQRRPRSPICASICCPTNRPSSPARNLRSTAALRRGEPVPTCGRARRRGYRAGSGWPGIRS